MRNLHSLGLAPEDFDKVILTHAHPDHIGGNLDSHGKP
ncbi:MAG: MBL fold metallo-hydrolase, partial [Candidatus Bathyarchaeia archaeon]